jgi:ribonuclease HI
VFQCFDKAWEATVAGRIQRKGFDVKQFSACAFKALMRKHGPRHQGLLTAIASGKNVTLDALSHYKDSDATCPFCDCVEDHRVFHCNGLHDLRCKHAKTVRWLKTQPDAVMHLGIVPDNCDAVMLRQETFSREIQNVLPLRETTGVVFTDGSCFCNSCWECALAGAAVIQVTGEFEWKLVTRAMLPTADHSAYRGEVYAILLALQAFWQVQIHSDCSAVVDEVNRIVALCVQGAKPVALNHADLWDLIIWQVLQRGGRGISIAKVKAHVDWKTVTDSVERQQAFFNNAVDAEARKSVAADHFELWQKMEGFLDAKKETRIGVGRYHDFLCEMYDMFFALKPRERKVVNQPSFDSMWKMQGTLRKFAGPSQEKIDMCPFGHVFAGRVGNWWNLLEWKTGTCTSLVELYFDFCMYTGTQAPVRFPGNQWRLRDTCVQADNSDLRLGLQLHMWVRFLRWLLEQSEGVTLKIQKSSALREYGYAKPIFSVNGRAQLVDGSRTSKAVWKYLHPGGYTVANFTRPWSPKQG